MKKENLTIIILTAIILFTVKVSLAQWQPDVRLTLNSADSYTWFSARCVTTSGNVLHLVWQDKRDGNFEIYYKRSIDEGVNWGSDTRLTNHSASSYFPSVSVSGSVLLVVWQDQRDGNDEIYYKRSADAGFSWGADTRLTNSSAYAGSPSVSVSGSVVHVVWRDSRDGNEEIYYKRSADGGINWGTDTRLTNNSAYSYFPSVSISGSIVHVVWQDERDGNEEIYYKRSPDGGVSWGTDTRLTNNSAASQIPRVSVSGSLVHVVWQDYRDENYEIYHKHSLNGGVSWRADDRLTDNVTDSKYPSVLVSGSAVHVVWQDQRNGNDEIYYKLANVDASGSVHWGTDTRLTSNSAASQHPSVSVSGSLLHVVWQDYRDGNWEIYYKRDPNGNPIGIKNINSEVPKEFSLEQNYPNPFNPTTNINFQIPNSGFVKLIIFDNLGREVATLVNENLSPGTYKADFNGSNLSSGVYYYKLITGEYTETKKMILIK